MRIEIPKIWKNVELREYAPEFGEAQIHVWVNPPVNLLEQFSGFLAGKITREDVDAAVSMIAELWNWEVVDVIELFEHAQSTDPKLFEWLVYKTFDLIKSHRMQVKKN